MLVLGAIPRLVNMALHDSDQAVRKKAVMVLSSESRNYQPGLDAVLRELPQQYYEGGNIDAGDMEAVDTLMEKVRAYRD